MKYTKMDYVNQKVNNVLIICISLLKSTERRAKILNEINLLKQNIKDIQLDFEFFDAIYGKTLPAEYLSLININHKLSSPNSRPFAVGEIGCLLSHLIVWQRIADQYYAQYDRVIIIEDDVYLVHDKLDEQMQSIVKNNADFIFLSGHSPKARTRIKGYPSSDTLYFNMIGSRYQYTMACAYSITPVRAQKLVLKMLKKISVADDWRYLISDLTIVPYYYFFEQGGQEDSAIEALRSEFIQEYKENRIKKNFIKIYQDIITQFKMLFCTQKTYQLSDFIQKKETNHHSSDKTDSSIHNSVS